MTPTNLKIQQKITIIIVDDTNAYLSSSTQDYNSSFVSTKEKMFIDISKCYGVVTLCTSRYIHFIQLLH
jgi:hypothetical protein